MGRPEHQKVTQISANPSKRIRYVDLDFTTPITGLGGSIQNFVYAPAGYLSQLVSMLIMYPAVLDASTGNKSVSLATGNSGLITLTYAQSPYNKSTLYRYGRWEDANTLEYPESEASQLSFFSMAFFDEDSPLQITFRNDTDAHDLGQAKYYRLWLLEEKIT